ncbi:MAG: hypothetical protein PUB45_06420 [Bacteroidales bacterium]|nr:hypothetical protein [Bacteroidales bacterium]
MRRHILFFISAVGILLSCQKENPDSLPGKGSIEIGLVSSKLTRGAADGDKMNNLHIWLVNGSGVVSDYLDTTYAYIDDKTGYCTIAADGKTASALFTQVDKGNYTLYFVANLPSDLPLDRYSKGKSIDSDFTDKLLASVVNNEPPYDESAGMPLTLVEDVSVGAGTNKLSAELVRTCARIRLTVRNNTVENSLVLRKVALSADGNPSTGYLFPRSDYSIPSSAVLGPFNSLELTALGETTDIVIRHGETHTYIDQYMYETGPKGSVSLGFTLAGGLFADGISSAEMGMVETGASGTRTVYTNEGQKTSITPNTVQYLIRSANGNFFLYDDGSGTPKATSATDPDDILGGTNPERFLWTFSATGPANISNVGTGNYLIVGTDETVTMSSEKKSVTIQNGFKFYNGTSSGRNNNKKCTAYTLSLSSGSVSILINTTSGRNAVITPSSDSSCNIYLYQVTSTEVPVPVTELKLKDNHGNAAKKYFDKTVTSLHYIGKYGTPVPLEHIYRNQDVQIVVNVHYNPSSGVLYFETTDWKDVNNETTFD